MALVDGAAGAAFPFRITPAGGVATAAGAEKIRQNVRVILSTRVGERVMVREFGTRLRSLVHDPNDAVLGSLAERQAREALLRWEPRVLITSSTLEQRDDELVVRLEYVHSDEPVASEAIVPVA